MTSPNGAPPTLLGLFQSVPSNSLSTIVSFLGSSMAGTSAPLNPGDKEQEFRFYLDDTKAKVLLPLECIQEVTR
jgi:hypothetical protein